MLYDKRWDAKVDVDPFSLDSLIAWLEKQPAQTEYCYTDIGTCLLSAYFSAAFGRPVRTGCMRANFIDPTSSDFHYPRAFQDVAADEPHNYGAALARARDIQSRSLTEQS